MITNSYRRRDQRSRLSWLRLGDSNTKFFQNVAKMHHRSHNLYCLKDEVGQSFSTEEDKRKICREYFNRIHTAEGDDSVRLFTLPTHLPRVIDDIDNNNSLMALPTEVEIRWAILAINRHKAFGLDGYDARFFQEFWLEIKYDIIHFVQDFFSRNFLDLAVNNTDIVLIPKKLNTICILDFQPFI